MAQSLESVLASVLQLPPDERERLIERLQHETPAESADVTEQKKAKSRALVEELFGSIKGLDREAIIRFAEDEEYCGY